MIFNKNINKETVKILLQENKRLKRENQRLNESLEELQRYKDEYKRLIDELDSVKNTYMKKMKIFENIEDNYKSELDRLLKNEKNRR